MSEIHETTEPMEPAPQSLYRTRWLMAHNRLHEIIHSGDPKTKTSLARRWDEYLAELRTAKSIAARSA